MIGLALQFITGPGETDILMSVMAVVLILAVLLVGVLYFRLHALPEHIAHRSHKLQLEIVAVLGLLALFTHEHLFWIAGLLLALIIALLTVIQFKVFPREAR